MKEVFRERKQEKKEDDERKKMEIGNEKYDATVARLVKKKGFKFKDAEFPTKNSSICPPDLW